VHNFGDLITITDRHEGNDNAKQVSCREAICPPLIAFGCGYSLPCCPRTNAFETTMRACRHLANGRELENGADRQTDGRTDSSIALLQTDVRHNNVTKESIDTTGPITGSVSMHQSVTADNHAGSSRWVITFVCLSVCVSVL